MRQRLFLTALTTLAILPAYAVHAESQPSGIVCIDPIATNWSREANESGATEKSNFTVQIDSLPPVQISTRSAGVFTNLTMHTTHLAKIRLDGKPLTSFRFSFEQSGGEHLRLWYNEFYGTWSLWATDARH